MKKTNEGARNLAEAIGQMSTPDILTITEACELLRVSRPTIMKMATAGTIPFITAGNRYRFSREAILSAVRTGEQPAIAHRKIKRRRARKA